MLSLVVLAFISVIIITSLSFISKDIEKRVLIPIVFGFISTLLFVISFIIGGWEGMGLGAVSVTLFVASIASLIITVLLYKVRRSRSGRIRPKIE